MTRTPVEVIPEQPRVSAELAGVEDAYRRYALSARKRRTWSARNPGNVAMRQELLERVRTLAANELTGPGDILDIGCGTGWWLRALADSGVRDRRLHGIELIAQRAAAARKTVPGATVLHGDARRLPFPDRGFAVVLLLNVLSSLPTRDVASSVLAEARRVLRPGGVVVIYDPRVPSPFNSHVRRVSRHELRVAFGPEATTTTLTMLPALSRRLGRLTGWAYPRLARLRCLRTHRLLVYRRGRD